MSDLNLFPSALPDLSVSQMTALPDQQLQELDVSLTELATWAKQMRERLNAALEQRFGDAARTALRDSGRDFGTIHISDGALRVTLEQRKLVTWDQQRLSDIAERIAASGERVQDYLDIEFSVSESRFNNWPPALRAQFEAARTVKPGKPSFRLALLDDLGA
ncbi:Uncharacterised protein [Burkholderia pseudomallei]|uniref:hypothetical protein n=1 Tax=Burkholderia pseudomallei TaxID=28450 RepID=UPI000976C1FD|nr:hypothetical protein [Burkholderia pseudomallei]OMS46657.1 hypothetical protein AQ740_18125 [Burkholderia pseudomallei]CAJ3062326.1 Uncharacterised protein [Burkholderia pseudomallei]CAJ3070558.1 Uncharacterised protein [Burkholderia pseudomallei]CAJ3708440.1 Uncharacterised protein [Burkholderia pseudomallei]CAJ3725006.1 Uncharacterised protein [Burkholderia pseudomallei]